MSATAGGGDSAAPLPAADVHVILFRRDLRVQDHEPLHRVSQLHGQTTPVQLIPLYVYDPLLLRHETSSTAHHLFIGDCLEELSRNLESLGSGLIIRVGHLNGILLSLLRQCNGRRMILWSHHVTGTLHERAHDAATREWCVAHGVTWNELPTGGVWPCSQRHSFQEWLQVWANDFDEYCAAPLFDVPTSSLPPLPLGLRRGQRPTLEAIARLGASHDHAITAAAVQRGGSREAHEVMKSFLTRRGRWYRSQLSSPITAASACSRLSPHLAWGSLSVRQVHRAVAARLATLVDATTSTTSSLPHAEATREATGWREAIDGFFQRIRWRAHNMQKFEATPESEMHNLVRGYDALRRIGGPAPAHPPRASEGSSAPATMVASAHSMAPASAVAHSVAPASADSSAPAADAAIAEDHAVVPASASAEAEAEEEERLFTAWRRGVTGYPLVDACIRCLDQTGWLNFRMRCLVVSFACYHLWLHWRRPAVWLARRFLDFEPGIHFSQAQSKHAIPIHPSCRARDRTSESTTIDHHARPWPLGAAASRGG